MRLTKEFKMLALVAKLFFVLILKARKKQVSIFVMNTGILTMCTHLFILHVILMKSRIKLLLSIVLYGS